MSRAHLRRLSPLMLMIGCLLLGSAATAVHAQAGSPTPPSPAAGSPAASTSEPAAGGAIDPGDPRSDGQGPGLVGEPLLVLVGIVVIGLATVVSTVAIARLTGRS